MKEASRNNESPTQVIHLGEDDIVQEVRLGNEAILLGNGVVVHPDGTFVYPNGVKFKIIRGEDGTVVGEQFFLPDGRRLNPGETVTLSDGTLLLRLKKISIF